MDLRRVAAAALLGLGLASAHALTFTPGHIYGTQDLGVQNNIVEFDESGKFLSRFDLGSDQGIQGLAFGRDSLLYVVTRNWYTDSSAVTSYRSDGSVAKRYEIPASSDGKIAFANDGETFFVNSRAGLYRFQIGNDAATLALPIGGNDFALLPDGRFLVAIFDHIRLYDQQGVMATAFGGKLADPNGIAGVQHPMLYGIQALEYDAKSGLTFVAATGYSDFGSRVIALPAFTSNIAAIGAVAGGSDMFLSDRGQLLVGSWSSSGAILSATSLQALNSNAMWVKYMTAMPVPEPNTSVLAVIGLALLWGYYSKHKAGAK